ncbi:MAG TPA: hypothetical protein VKE53_07615 [Pseudolabrys sp.]|nr:hypothetical protein [Pseudolabrys sp.]
MNLQVNNNLALEWPPDIVPLSPPKRGPTLAPGSQLGSFRVAPRIFGAQRRELISRAARDRLIDT